MLPAQIACDWILRPRCLFGRGRQKRRWVAGILLGLGSATPREGISSARKTRRVGTKGDEETSEKNDADSGTQEADFKDFNAGLKEGRIKPVDPAKATQQHKDARIMIMGSSPLPPEFDSEFADYHRGAWAFHNEKWDEARKAWEDLLKRPEQDRHYRAVWAAFMLGKLALKTKDYPTAAKWFERTREFAKAEFADSLGLAAESYGWEGRAEWKQEHPEKAAPLFLTQLALGDPSAVVSLKALVPTASGRRDAELWPRIG